MNYPNYFTFVLSFSFDTFKCDFSYRKYNPIGEKVQKTAKPEMATFQTDFNVTFGLGICFDVLNADPLIPLVDRGVRNFAFPTQWNAELPFTAGKWQD